MDTAMPCIILLDRLLGSGHVNVSVSVWYHAKHPWDSQTSHVKTD